MSLARTLSPEMRRIEDSLTKITQAMKNGVRENSDGLLAEITVLAAELEANAALSLYRFGASRACQSIEERQANLSRKLSRATALLRSWIYVELERQTVR